MQKTQNTKESTPTAPILAVHLDLKGLPPTPDRLISLLKVISLAKYNALLVEWEDMFPWTVDVRFRSDTAYEPADIKRFVEAAGELGLEIIPLVQCLGHMETPLGISDYKHLREVPFRPDGLNPLAPGAGDLVWNMVEDVLDSMPSLRFFHLGGDEHPTFGTHPDTKEYVAKHGKGALYLRHVEPITKKLTSRGIRPLLWDDMMRGWSAAELRNMASEADLVVWRYQGAPTDEHMQKFAENGVRLWGAAAYKGADGHYRDLPVPERRLANILAWMKLAEKFALQGLIATAWSRYSTHYLQNEPIDSALDLLLLSGWIWHDGQEPEGGLETCIAALETIGESKRFKACKAVMERLTKLREDAAFHIRLTRELLANAVIDGRLRGTPYPLYAFKNVLREAAAVEEVLSQAQAAFEGLLHPLCLEHYLLPRVTPILEQAAELEPRMREIEPGFYNQGVHKP